jgi:hypothetical protein
MPYYPTIEEDLKRAKEILEKGKIDLKDFSAMSRLHESLGEDDAATFMAAVGRHGGTIYGADTFAAYKLLESFVEEIERLQTEVKTSHSLIARSRSVLSRYENLDGAVRYQRVLQDFAHLALKL